MTTLHLTLPAFSGEPAIGLASRIAMKHGITHVADCVSDLGVSWPHFQNGRQSAIEEFADIVGADSGLLARESFQPRPEGRFSFRGHLLDRPMAHRRAVRLCPRCILEDNDRGGRLERHSRAYWQLSQFRTCPVHGAPIITLPHAKSQRCAMDFAQIVDNKFEFIQHEAATATFRTNQFETWLLTRLEEQKPGHWFDNLAISVVAQFCEKAGVALCFGAQASPGQMTEDQLAAATETAFQRLISSVDGFQPLLCEIWKNCPSLRGGYYSSFGNLWRWLVTVQSDQRYEPLVSEVAEFVFDHQPIPAGTFLLGKECKARRCHSVNSAAATFGLNTSRTVRLLKKMTEKGRILSVDEVEPLLSTLASHLPRVKAAKRLGVTPDMFDRFKRVGLVRPVFTTENVADLYSQHDIDHLRNAVFDQAVLVQGPPPGCSRVAVAASAASVNAEEIISMIVEKQLCFVGRQQGAHRICDLYVNREELRDLVYGPVAWPPEGWLTIEQSRAALHLNTETIAWFMRQGHLPTRRHWNQRQRRHNRLVAEVDLAEFSDRYVSLGALAAEARIQANHVARRLERKGIIPIDFPPNLNKVFLREEVQPAEHVGRSVAKSAEFIGETPWKSSKPI